MNDPSVDLSGGRWFKRGDEVVTWWANQAIRVTQNFGSEGVKEIGLSARNSGKIPSGYQFEVKVKVDGQAVGTITVDGNSRENEKGFLSLNTPVQGRHTVEYTWVNDLWRPKEGIDANIRIHRFLFQ